MRNAKVTKNEKKIEKAMKLNNINGFFDTCQAVYGTFNTRSGETKRGWFAFRHSNANYEFLGHSVDFAIENIMDRQV